MANEYSDVDCAEIEGSFTEVQNESTWTQNVSLVCDWSDRNDLIGSIRGNRHPTIGSGGNPPIAIGFRVQGLESKDSTDSAAQQFYYKTAQVDVTYKILTPQAPAGGGPNDPSPTFNYEYYTETIEPTIEQLRWSHRRLRWGQGANSRLIEPEEAPTFPVFRERFSRTYIGLVTPIGTAFSTLQGKINKDPVVSNIIGVTYPAQTVLYSNRTINASSSATNFGIDNRVNMTLNFMYRQETWRKFYDVETNNFEKMYTASGSEVQWPQEADLSPVLF